MVISCESPARELCEKPRHKVEIAGPGFINIDVTDETLAVWAARTTGDEQLGFTREGPTLKVLVDYPTPTEEFVIVERMTAAYDSPGRARMQKP